MKMIPALVASTIAAVGLATALSGCSALVSQPTEWVASDSMSATYLSWTDNNGQITGAAQEATGDDLVSATRVVSTSQMKITGTEARGKITLQVGGAILGVTLTGSINNSALLLESSTSDGSGTSKFIPAGALAYNADVAKLKKSMTTKQAAAVVAQQKAQAAAAIAQQQAQAAAQLAQDSQTLNGALNDIASDSQTLKTDIGSMATSTSDTNAAMATLASDTAAATQSACYQSDATSTAQQQVSNATSYIDGLTSYSVDEDVSSLNQDIKTATGLEASLYTPAIRTQIQAAQTLADSGATASKTANALATADQNTVSSDSDAIFAINYC